MTFDDENEDYDDPAHHSSYDHEEDADEDESSSLHPEEDSPHCCNNGSFDNINCSIQQKNQSLRDCILALPRWEKAAFLFAYQQARTTVLNETPPTQFVRCDNGNMEHTAHRLTSYWRWKWKLFSVEDSPLKFVQPLHYRELPPDVRYLLQTGFLSLLPCDVMNRPVVCFDVSRMMAAPALSYLQAAFFVWSALCGCCSSEPHSAPLPTSPPVDGYIFLIVLQSDSFLDDTVQMWVDMILESFPIHAARLHIVASNDDKNDDDSNIVWEENNRRPTVLNMRTLPRALKVLGKLMRDREVQIHIPPHHHNRTHDFTPELEQYGLTAVHLPTSVGGTWVYDQWNAWLRDQERSDQLDLFLQAALANTDEPSGGNSSNSRCHTAAPPILEWQGRAFASTTVPLLGLKPSPPDSLGSTTAGDSDLTNAAVVLTTTTTTVSLDIALGMMTMMDEVDGDLRALEEARKLAPQLVERESPWPRFLHCAKNATSQDAVVQLANWWTVRKQLFGKKYLLPLTQTGEGALGRKEVALLRQECFLWMPKDENGRVALYLDLMRALKECDERSVLKCAFYAVQVAFERAVGGLSLLIPLSAADLPEWHCRIHLADFWTVIPTNVLDVHFVSVDPLCPTQRDKIIEFFGLTGLDTCTKFHCPISSEALLQELLLNGFDQERLPTCFGGKFNSKKFAQFMELRVRLEWDLPPGTRNKEVINMFDFSKIKALADLTELELIERKRRMNILHTRRKRDREQMEESGMGEQCQTLKAENARLREENDRLEEMLCVAKEKMTSQGLASPEHNSTSWKLQESSNSVTPGRGDETDTTSSTQSIVPSVNPDKTALKRSMNRLYSQRKREKERSIIETLSEKCDTLRACNRSLILENLWMEELFEAALQEVSRIEGSESSGRARDNEAIKKIVCK